MKHPLLIGAALLALMGGAALAQTTATAPPTTTTTTTTIKVGHGIYPVSVPSDQPLVLWAAETIVTPGGQFAKAYIIVQTSEGQWVTLTPCDDIAVTCEPVLMRMDGVSQGQQFYLGGS